MNVVHSYLENYLDVVHRYLENYCNAVHSYYLVSCIKCEHRTIVLHSIDPSILAIPYTCINQIVLCHQTVCIERSNCL